MYDISIKIFIIENITLKRTKYIVSFGLVSGIVVLAVSATMDFSRVMFHPTLETESAGRCSGQGLSTDIAIWWIVSALWDVLAFVLYRNIHRNPYQQTKISSSNFFNHIINDSKKKYGRIFCLDSTALKKQEYQHTRMIDMMLWMMVMCFAFVGCY